MTKRIAIISTGGTIEKSYNEFTGALANKVNVLDVMLSQLRLLGVEIVRVPLLNKDSLDMTESDHQLIARTAQTMADAHDGVIVVHGTDRLTVSGERTFALNPNPSAPIVFTGAMRPYELRTTDAMQNLVEALLAVQLVSAGVYVSMHNQVLAFPGVVKDMQELCFVRRDTTGEQP